MLKANEISGMSGSGSSAKEFTLVDTDTVTNDNSVSVEVDLGDLVSGGTRHIIIAICGGDGSTGTLSSIDATLGGAAVDEVHDQLDNDEGSSDPSYAWIGIIEDNTNLTATLEIDLDYSGTMNKCAIAVFRVANLPSATYSDRERDGDGSISGLTIPDSGFCVVVAAEPSANSTMSDFAQGTEAFKSTGVICYYHNVAGSFDWSTNADSAIVGACWAL